MILTWSFIQYCGILGPTFVVPITSARRHVQTPPICAVLIQVCINYLQAAAALIHGLDSRQHHVHIIQSAASFTTQKTSLNSAAHAVGSWGGSLVQQILLVYVARFWTSKSNRNPTAEVWALPKGWKYIYMYAMLEPKPEADPAGRGSPSLISSLPVQILAIWQKKQKPVCGI